MSEKVKSTGLPTGYYYEKGKDLWVINPDGTATKVQELGDADAARAAANNFNAMRTADRQIEFAASMNTKTLEAAERVAWNNYENAKAEADRVLARMPETASDAAGHLEWQLENVSSLQEAEFYKALDSVFPEWRTEMNGIVAESQGNINKISERFRSEVLPNALEAINKTALEDMRNTMARLNGETDPGVAAQLKAQASRTYTQILDRDQAAKGLQARDLGHTRNQMFTAGASGIGDTANKVLGNYAAAFGVVNNASQVGAGNLQIQQMFQAPRDDPYKGWQNYYNMQTGAGAISMDTAIQASGNWSQTAGQGFANLVGHGLSLSTGISNTILHQNIAQQTMAAERQAQNRAVGGALTGLGMGLAAYGAYNYGGTSANT